MNIRTKSPRPTKKTFVATNPEVLRKMRRNDPYQFQILYLEWGRKELDKMAQQKRFEEQFKA